MLRFFKSFLFCLKNADTVEELVDEAKRKADREKMKQEMYRLKLCDKHNPVRGLPNYATHNCDYCSLEPFTSKPSISYDVKFKFYPTGTPVAVQKTQSQF